MEKRFSLRLSDNCEFDLIEFANSQSNFTDSVKYLIEKEIFENGIRNLQEHIPSKRSVNYFKKEQGKKNE